MQQDIRDKTAENKSFEFEMKRVEVDRGVESSPEQMAEGVAELKAEIEALSGQLVVLNNENTELRTKLGDINN